MADTKERSLSEQTLATQVAQIMRMNNTQLYQTWTELLGSEPPRLNTKVLRQRLAWKVQEQALGGLSDKAKARLKQVKMSIIKGRKITRTKTCQLPAGTRLIREFKGESHEVVVTSEGFEYQGEVYRSLTKIANLITGSKWNGPAFFGLRKEQQKARLERRRRK